jgi:hypothetical protein
MVIEVDLCPGLLSSIMSIGRHKEISVEESTTAHTAENMFRNDRIVEGAQRTLYFFIVH